MRLVQFEHSGRQGLGVELSDGGDIVDLVAGDPAIPSNMKLFIESGQSSLDAAQRVVDSEKHRIPRAEVRLLAPITAPDKVICVGMNYYDHCLENNSPIPKEPVIFNKFPSCIIGPYDDMPYPDETEELDWEVEMTIVIGKKGKKINVSEATNHIFGYTIAHDVSAREWQLKRNGGQWFLGKTMDGFCPLGPAIITKDSIDPHNLNLKCLVNGVTKQDSSTNQMIFKPADIVIFLSRFITLLPGDIILTGTPPGVGVFKKPPEFLKRGDVVQCEIAEIGKIVNKIV